MHALVLTQNDVVSPKYGGSLRITSLVGELRKRGARVSIIRFRRAGDVPTPRQTDLYEVEVPRHYEMASVAALYHWLSRAAERKAEHIHRANKIDLVQSDPPWPSLSGERIARHVGVPHVVLSQNCESALAAQFSRTGPARRIPLAGAAIANLNLKVLRWAEKQAVERADLTLTPSEADREEMAALGMSTDRVHLLPNGTRVQRLPKDARTKARQALGIGPESPVVVFLGRLDYLPNRQALDTIRERIAPLCPEVTFMVVGSNPPPIEATDNVMMVGQVESVDEYLRVSDLSVVPITQGSGTRIKILDAWAAGLPVLSTSMGASGLNYRNWQDIVIEDDVERFAERVREMLGRPECLTLLVEGSLRAVAPYRWEAIGERYVQMLHTLVRAA